MPYRLYEQEAQLRTDEQAGTAVQVFAKTFKTDDPDNPQEVIAYGEGREKRTSLDDVAKKPFKQKSQLGTSEQAGTSVQETPRAYPDEA